MNSAKNLQQLLRSIEPKLKEGEYVYCSVDEKTLQRLTASPLLIFKEDEGITLITEKSQADFHSLEYEGIWELVTLSVYSSLSAIGFIAAITRYLTDYGISTNVISAFYHDNLLVPYGEGERVVKLLGELQNSYK